ncbi:MAG TPA: hypothetical protein VFK43_05240, partial [Acidimicrobiales bacterium]|nr:hypothetical protein [Acidimicrobiales bacterium]
MTKRHDRHTPGPAAPAERKLPVLALALGALAIVVVIGLIIALAGGDDGDPTDGGTAGGDTVIAREDVTFG